MLWSKFALNALGFDFLCEPDGTREGGGHYSINRVACPIRNLCLRNNEEGIFFRVEFWQLPSIVLATQNPQDTFTEQPETQNKKSIFT